MGFFFTKMLLCNIKVWLYCFYIDTLASVFFFFFWVNSPHWLLFVCRCISILMCLSLPLLLKLYVIFIWRGQRRIYCRRICIQLRQNSFMNIIRHRVWIPSKHGLAVSRFANPGCLKLKKENVYCSRLFGVTGNCAACSKLIPAFEMVMRAKDNVYHLDCFACQLCNQRWGHLVHLIWPPKWCHSGGWG